MIHEFFGSVNFSRVKCKIKHTKCQELRSLVDRMYSSLSSSKTRIMNGFKWPQFRAKDEAENMRLFPCSHFRIKVQWLRTDRVWGQKVWAIRGFRTKILNLTWLFKNKLHATSDIHTREKRGREKGRVTVTWHTLIGVRKMDHSDMHFSFLEILLLQKYENRFQPSVGLKQEIIKKVSA